MLTELGKKIKEEIQKKLEEEHKKEDEIIFKLANEFGDHYFNLTEFEKPN